MKGRFVLEVTVGGVNYRRDPAELGKQDRSYGL